MRGWIVTAVLSANIFVVQTSRAAIFGTDNRHAVTETSPLLEFARATAVAVISTNMSINANGGLDLDVDHLTNLCSNERFFGEPSLSYACTGFLVAPDLLVTAGHCVYAVNTAHQELRHESKLACATFSWLFDYQSSNKSVAATTNLSPDRLYRCKEIVYARQTESAPFLDYALIRLDRPAFGRTPFRIASAPVKLGLGVAMMGYPFGSPVKFTDSARVTLNDLKRDSFLTSLDAFEGNSGSPVMNSAREVVGILIGGTPMENLWRDRTCDRPNRCDENGTRCNQVDTSETIRHLSGYQGIGSEVQRIQPILDLLKPDAKMR